MTVPSRRRTAVSVMLFSLGLAAGTGAQVATATLAGVARDDSGGALPGVTLTVRSVETGATRTAITDGEGRYRVPALDPGTYDLRSASSTPPTWPSTGARSAGS